jgi:hypothetical protein
MALAELEARVGGEAGSGSSGPSSRPAGNNAVSAAAIAGAYRAVVSHVREARPRARRARRRHGSV